MKRFLASPLFWVFSAVLVAAIAAVGVAMVYIVPPMSGPRSLPKAPKGPPKDAEVAEVGPKGAKGADPGKIDLPPAKSDEDPTPAEEPEEWRGGGPHTLRIQKMKVPLTGAAKIGGPNEIEALTYNGKLVGPTIRVRRGDTLKINVINDLPKEGAPPVKVDPKQPDVAHDLYTTNIHTHGLHVSPIGDSDWIYREIVPGTSFQYTYTIPLDHAAGTFWYHPHKHGSVAYQMANGMAGALIVEGEPNGKVMDLDRIPEIAKAKERILVIQQFTLQKDKQGVGWVDPDEVYDLPTPTAFQTYAVNGVVMPTYYMQPKEVQRWRFIHAGREEDPIQVLYHDEKGKIYNPLVSNEIAIDGLATGSIEIKSFLKLWPGSRSDVLLKAPAVRGTYFMIVAVENEDPVPRPGRPKIVLKRVAKLVVQGEEKAMNFPTFKQLAPCKTYESISAAECKVKREFVIEFDDVKKIFRINGVSYSKQAIVDKPLLGSAEEWTLTSTNREHPFHIHVNPFQIIQIEDMKTKKIRVVGEWRDTFGIIEGRKVTIRMRFRDFPGKSVLHCHTLDHEDQGMMLNFEIVDPKRPAGAAADPSVELATCSIPAPVLKLPSALKTPFELKSLKQGNVILVFFRGMTCRHCTQQLRNLLEEVRDLAGTGTTIVAVSSEPIAELDKAVQSLGVPPGVGFQLLVDEDRLGFRAFGCYDQGPRHGLFVIDKAGTIRSRYIGDSPFAEAAEVRARLGQLLTADRRVSMQGAQQK